MLLQYSIGIDIRADSLFIMLLRGSLKKVAVAAHAVYSLEKDKPLRDNLPVIHELIRDFMAKHPVSAANAFLGIPQRHVILRELDFPLAVKENLRTTLGFEMEKYFPIALEDLYFDYQITVEDKENNQLRVLLVVAKKKVLAPYLELAKDLEFGFSGIESSSTALVNYLSFDPQTAGLNNYAFVCGQKSEIEIGLVRAQRLSHTRFVETAGLGIEALAGAVQSELGAFAAEGEAHRADAPLVVCGPEMEGALFSRLQRLSGFDAIRVDPATALAPAGHLNPAFGLALKGLRKLPTDINLLPIEMRKKPSRAAYYALLFLVSLSVLLAIGWAGSRIVRQKTTVNRLDAEISRLTTEMKGIDQVQSKIKAIEVKVDFLNALVSERLPALDVLKELSQRIPDSAWVQDFTFSDRGVQLNGYAESASELLPVLETSTFFKDATFLSTITKGRDGKERFSIGLKLR